MADAASSAGQQLTVLARTLLTNFQIYESTCRRTTWWFRLGVLALVVLVVSATRGLWTDGLARRLIFDARLDPVDAILIENFDRSTCCSSALRSCGAEVASRVIADASAVRCP
jgi:hypothetical protein